MDGSITGAWVCIGAILLAGVVIFSRRGAAEALGIVVVLSFLVPTWLQVPIMGTMMPVRTVVSMVALLAFTFRDPRQIISPLTILDCLIAGTVVVHFASDVRRGWDPVSAGFMSYGEWAIPFVAGRYAVRTGKAIEPLAMCICGVVIILGLGGMIEMFSGINPWEAVFGNRPVDGYPRESTRYGLKRAFGPTRHPIYFGLLMLVLSPWPISYCLWAKTSQQRALAASSTLASFGLISSISRGPVMAWGIMLALLGSIWARWYRWALGFLTLVLLIAIVANPGSILTKMDEWGKDWHGGGKITLDGKEIQNSSARQRLLLLQVFWPAMREAGLLGYGSNAMLQLPPDVPYLPADDKTRESLKYVDNAYVFYVLRFGWGGAVLFTLLLIAATYTAVRLSWDRSIGILTGATASMIVAMAISLLTVWFCYDFGFELLWTYGVLAGLRSYNS